MISFFINGRNLARSLFGCLNLARSSLVGIPDIVSIAQWRR